MQVLVALSFTRICCLLLLSILGDVALCKVYCLSVGKHVPAVVRVPGRVWRKYIPLKNTGYRGAFSRQCGVLSLDSVSNSLDSHTFCTRPSRQATQLSNSCDIPHKSRASQRPLFVQILPSLQITALHPPTVNNLFHVFVVCLPVRLEILHLVRLPGLHHVRRSVTSAL